MRGGSRTKAATDKSDAVSKIEKATQNVGLEGTGLMEGDIMSPPEKNRAAPNDRLNEKRKSKRMTINPDYLPSGYHKWPLGIIPYAIDETTYSAAGFTTVSKAVSDAMDAWMSKTCVKFIPAGPQAAAAVKHNRSLRIFSASGSGCWSYVGYQDSDYPQDISISENGCIYKGVIMHELGHAMGLVHAQSRPDRESYVTILLNNVPTWYAFNFYKSFYPSVTLPTPYDVYSVMHYGASDFSANSKATIVPRNTGLINLLGNRKEASFYDFKSINTLYGCSGQCTTTCLNDGYPLQLSNGNCSCICPYGLGGARCEKIVLQCKDVECGRVIALSPSQPTVNFFSPNYPQSYPVGGAYGWLLQAPPGYVVKLSFTAFDIRSSPAQCHHYVDIRANLIGQPAPMVYCGAGLPDIIYSRYDQSGSSIMVILDASANASGSTGFAATASAYKDGCLNDPCRGAPCSSSAGSSSYECRPPADNITCSFESIVSAGCAAVQMNSPYNAFGDDSTQRTWELRPSSDDVSAADGSFYLGTYASAQGAGDAKGTFRITPYIYTAAGRCLRFQYFVSNNNSGYLNLYRAVNGVLGGAIFSSGGSRSGQWIAASLQIFGTTPTSGDLIEIVFEAIHGSGALDSSLIAVDNIKYSAGACPTGPCAADPCGSLACTVLGDTSYSCAAAPILSSGNASCGFENWEDCSALLNYTVTGDTAGLDWRTYIWSGPGITWPRATGAMGPASGLTYLYGKLYDRRVSNKIWLRIKAFSGIKRCLRFKYSMFGLDVGSLSVYRSLNGVYPGNKLWSVSGNQGSMWRGAAVNVDNSAIATSSIIELTIESVRGNGYASDYGIDDVFYTEGLCA